MEDPLHQQLSEARAELAHSEAEARRAADVAARTGLQADVDRALRAHERLALLRITARACEEGMVRRRAVEESDPYRYTI